MEEVRSYWQVASVSHFCTLFGKQFKLPDFEPEELEQAFILEIPPAPNSNNNNNSSKPTSANNIEPQQQQSKSHNNIKSDGYDTSSTHDIDDEEDEFNEARPKRRAVESPAFSDNDFDYKPPVQLEQQIILNQQQQQQQQLADEQPELHLLVKLGIALLKPHFNSKISHANWENYLRRIIDANWVELEHHPSPFRIPIISQDGVELTKNLTFNELPLSDKIDIFFALCDYRLWAEDASDAIKDFTVEELRLESVGKDSHGYEYWYFSGTRLYRENKDLSQDIILRKKRIKELEYSLVDFEKQRIFKEQEERRKLELEIARQLAAEAREARSAAKKQQEQDTAKRKKQSTPILPPRTGLRERRPSATCNNNDSAKAPTPTTRSRQAKQQQPQQQPEQNQHQKTMRSSTKSSKNHNQGREKATSPDVPKKPTEKEAKEELERLAITKEDRAEAWSLQCDSLEEWENFVARFAKTKSTNEKYLYAYINEELLPNIRAIYTKRAAEARRKEKELLLSLASRRVSTRIISKRAQEEEEERRAQLHEAEVRRKKAEGEERLRAELEREMRAKKNRFVNGGTSSTCSEDGEETNGRYNLRQTAHLSMDSDEFEGIIHPDKLSEFYEAVELVIDTVRTSKHAWPFVDPVPQAVPGYYDLISKPMDLKKIRARIEFRKYRCLVELEKDFQLIVNNCEKFNGPKNVYTKMAYKLWKSFRKNVRLYLQRDLTMDEFTTFVYPPQPKDELHNEAARDEVSNGPVEGTEDEVTAKLENGNQPNTDYPSDVEQSIIEFDVEQEPIDFNETRTIDGPTEVKPKLMEVAESQQSQNNHQDPQEIPQAQEKPIKVEEVATPHLPEPIKLGQPIQEFIKPETMEEEIIIDSYDVPCPDDNLTQYICSYDVLQHSSMSSNGY